MTFTWCLHLLLLCVILKADSCSGAVPPCNPPLLGSPCRYKCHCLNNKCDTNAECTESTGCEHGWFGPACQYEDLLTINATTTTPGWVYEFPDTLCNTGAQEPVTISLKGVAYFTWLRLKLRANATVSSQAFQLQLKSTSNSPVHCSNMYTSEVSDTILDIHCQPGVFFQELDITGEGVRSLCQVYISGGRNVALGQQTNQTSDFYNQSSWHAVDGDTNSYYVHGSCTHTDPTDNTPTWMLTFGRPHHLNRYVLYNRNTLQERLQGFNIEADQQNGSVAFSYTDPNTIQSIYRIQSDTPHIPVSSVTIVATNRNGGPFLSLCEVEMFGDAVCPPGKYGRDCNNSCNCAKIGDNCFVSTGGCPSGCAAGYHGEGCQIPCPQKTFGQDCRETCSTNCSWQFCNRVNGKCTLCVPRKTGDYCDQDCDDTFWGDNCTKCEKNCKNQVCNIVNGTCNSCVAGKTGVHCGEDCNATFYGENCAHPCSSNCANRHCNALNGNCKSCVIGKSGLYCEEVCPQKTFGQNCRETCSTNCSRELCDRVNGKCESCVPGTTGDFCDLELQVSPPDNSPPVAVIVGPVVAFVVLIILIVIGVLIWRTRRHKKDGFEGSTPHRINNYENIDSIRTVESSAATTMPDTGVTAQEKPPVMKKPKRSPDGKNSHTKRVGGDYYNQLSSRSETAIRFEDLDKFMATHGKEFYQEQFNRIPANSSATTTVAMSPENLNKNRYKNICAYDHSRVHLQTDILKNHGDYINASYIDGFQQKKQFIASQGPTKVILEDFVRMLWEQEVEVVVMLTNLVEDGKLKCEQYWPDDGEVDIGEVTVKLTTTQVFADFTIRRLCLYKKSPQAGTDRPVLVLTHFHFTTWPDKDVPTTAWGLVDLEQRMSSISTSKPILVHCSAGVGRTGTFIALHNILEEINHSGYLDVFATVQKLRQDRIHMVQTFQQYEFVHRATQIAMVCRDTTVTTGNIRERTQLLEENSESGQSKLDKEYKSVCVICAEDESYQDVEEVQENNTYCNSRLLSNKLKNRLHNVLPKEYYRPVLRCEAEGLEDYINAVLIPSCKKHDNQILTQLPLPATVVDFWRLVTQYKVSLIVAFERHLSTEDMTIGDYLPEGEDTPKTCSFFNIKTTGLDAVDAWEVHRLTISVNEESASKMTNAPLKGEYNLSHLTWKGRQLDPKSLLTLMEKVRAMKPAGEGRILFTCRNGAELSGLACTLSLLLDRMDNDQRVSVPLVVGTVKAIRPQIIPTLDQYRLLYQALNLYNETHNEYSNIGTSRPSKHLNQH